MEIEIPGSGGAGVGKQNPKDPKHPNVYNMYIYMYVYIYIYTCTYIYIYTHICICGLRTRNCNNAFEDILCIWVLGPLGIQETHYPRAKKRVHLDEVRLQQIGLRQVHVRAHRALAPTQRNAGAPLLPPAIHPPAHPDKDPIRRISSLVWPCFGWVCVHGRGWYLAL